MNALKESAELQELLEAMDTVIGATPAPPQAREPTSIVDDIEDEDIQPIVDRIERREEQRSVSL